MVAKSKLTYKVYEDRGSGRWRLWEIATAERQVIERGSARSAIEARAEAVRRGLAATQSSSSGSKHKSERGIPGAPRPRSQCNGQIGALEPWRR